ncbi:MULTISPECIES: TetR/AcrR family transcriptional regulator [Nocardiaceae]|uniref:TetR/AcrR family transcriptional regulator n=1 Tax=Nocardiaceae TaxID=85025 RepID=UPI00148328EB|nr:MULTISPECIES: TetR/AcrR family transcriptional regulator [Rhodococcus]
MPTKSESPVIDGRMVRGNRTRKQLLDAALQLFGTKGFDATSMKDLAESAGVRAPSIYNHFASKESILAAALVAGLTKFQAYVMGPDNPAESGLQRLEGVVRRHIVWQTYGTGSVRAADKLLESIAAGEILTVSARHNIDELLLRYREFVDGLIDELKSSSDLDLPATRVCTSAVLMFCDRAHSLHGPDADVDRRQIEDEGWTLVSGMLGLRSVRLPMN